MAKARIAIIGAGLMGHGLAQVFAVAGHSVAVFDPDPEARADVRKRIAANLKGEKSAKAAIGRVTPVDAIAQAADQADFVIEAAPEKLGLKQEIFAELERAAPR